MIYNINILKLIEMNYSIIIPVFKEEKNIAKMISKVDYELRKKKIKYELIFVDDDSLDGSKKIFEKHKNKKTRFFIRKEKPRDLSKSVIFGSRKSKFNNLIVMDETFNIILKIYLNL